MEAAAANTTGADQDWSRKQQRAVNTSTIIRREQGLRARAGEGGCTQLVITAPEGMYYMSIYCLVICRALTIASCAAMALGTPVVTRQGPSSRPTTRRTLEE